MTQPADPVRLYTYIVKYDSGLAPNPFFGYCTVAVCTPNHMRIRLKVGDWLAGFRPTSKNHRFLFAMKVSEIIDHDEYWRDPRFRRKRPVENGTWKQRCGDNFYSRSAKGRWIHHPNSAHHSRMVIKKDLSQGRVYIASKFWYFGQGSVLPPRPPLHLRGLVGKRGVRVNHDEGLVLDFLAWIQHKKPGVHGKPSNVIAPNEANTRFRCRHCDGSERRVQPVRKDRGAAQSCS